MCNQVNPPWVKLTISFLQCGQVSLLRDGSLSGIEGLYTCTILDEFGVNQTLAVALYRSAEYDMSSKYTIH